LSCTGASTAVTGSKTTSFGIVIGLAKPGNGQAVPSLTTSGSPVIGQSMDIILGSARANTVALCPVGSSDTLWAALPLPFDMTVIGAPGCFLRASLDGLIVGVATDAQGSAKFTLPIPNLAGLLGVQFYNQYTVFDGPANAIGLVTTNAGRGLIGEQ
jgi:hypothetical protein